MTAGDNDTPEMAAYLKQRAREGRGDGHYEVDFYPWPAVSRYTMIAKVLADAKDGSAEAGLIPCCIEKSGNITVRTRENGGEEVLDFIRRQTDGADLGVELVWNEDGTFVHMKEKQRRGRD